MIKPKANAANTNGRSSAFSRDARVLLRKKNRYHQARAQGG